MSLLAEDLITSSRGAEANWYSCHPPCPLCCRSLLFFLACCGVRTWSTCALGLLACTQSPTLCLRSVVWSQLVSPPCSLCYAQDRLVSPLCPSKCLVSVVGLCWQTGSMSFSGQNILDSPWQVPDGCCQMETESFLPGVSLSIRVSSPFRDSGVLKIVKT